MNKQFEDLRVLFKLSQHKVPMRTIPGCDREALGRLMDEGLVIVEEFPGRIKNHYATLTDSGLDRAEQLAALYK